ncbi:MAG: hypothetical protein RLZZ337_1633 [Bacteroidota bacterium]
MLRTKVTFTVDTIKFYNLFIECGFKFSTDSRNIAEGGIFFALKGANFNGNEFALQALEKGAKYAVIDEEVGNDSRLILVQDVLTYFQEVANFHRKCFDIPVIAVCGSNGKTTTKNLMFSVLSKKYKTHCTQGNFNNHIGLPITLLQIPQDCEMAIIELGTNNPGEIADLCKITEPNFGLITNIGKEHLEGFGTLEAVAKEESELYAWLKKHKGIAFVNEDDEHLGRMSRGLDAKVPYTKNEFDNHRVVPSIQFEYKNNQVTSSLMGDYNLDNILTAITIGEYFKVETVDIIAGIEGYFPDNNRSQIIERDSNLIWLDAYNANPSSMQKAIENFGKMPQETKVLVLGDMFEMGEAAEQEHNALLQWIVDLGFKNIYLLGDHFAAVSQNCGITTFQSMEDLGQAITSQKFTKAAFLVKGSRGMKMERVVDYV